MFPSTSEGAEAQQISAKRPKEPSSCLAKLRPVEFLKRNIPWLIVVLVLVVGTLWIQNRPPEVKVVQAQAKDLAEILAVSGQVRGREESRLAPEVNGTVAAIEVEEGQLVQTGDVLAKLNTDRLQAQYDQAVQRVSVASAQLGVASRGPLESELAEVRSEIRKAEAIASANLASAQQQLLESQRGPRQEQVRQARAEQTQALADKDQRARDFMRQKELYEKGAISKQAYEQSATTLKQAKGALTRAQQRVAELQNGTRPEQVARARESVRAAQADLSAAQSTGQARLQQLLDRPRPEDVNLAQAQLQEAQAALEIAKEQLQQAIITAPYEGTVGKRLLRVGDLAGPSAPIFTFASQLALEVRVEIDESERARVKEGMTGVVRASGYPNSFRAKVAEFAAEIDSLKGTLEVRLLADEPPDWLLPGQTVDVNILLSPQQERLLVPLTCVVLEGEKSSALVVESGKIAKRDISVASPSKDGYLVLSGLEQDDWVVLYPQGFEVGDTVRPDEVEADEI